MFIYDKEVHLLLSLINEYGMECSRGMGNDRISDVYNRIRKLILSIDIRLCDSENEVDLQKDYL